ncbi:hypothetical protein R1sor_005283 [Riccia sorocarpa]|uniref:SprT-like domain-containing protein n=1 Tax=Riccia sorocarpa TaxID=122646 RepID=A0ABD3HMK8_9MARC
MVFLERVANCLRCAMNVVQSKAWERPIRRIVDRASTYPQGYGFLHRNRIKLDEVFNGNSGHSLIRMLLGYLTETPPDVYGWESSLIIRRFLASVQIILSVDYLGPGSGSSKVDFVRASSEFPSVPVCKISVATSYCKFLLEKGIPDMDLHCAEAAIEITIAHELVHVATAYLFGEKRTPREFPFIHHGGDPHSSFYCERHGNNGFIGLYTPSTPGRVVRVGMELIDRSEKRGVLDTWVSSYVAVRDYPDRLTNEIMDLEAQSIRNAFSNKAWMVEDKDERQCDGGFGEPLEKGKDEPSNPTSKRGKSDKHPGGVAANGDKEGGLIWAVPSHLEFLLFCSSTFYLLQESHEAHTGH